MMLFCLVLSYVIVKAWEQARAQAGAEVRRAREHVRGQFENRMTAGAASTPWGDPWWWLAAGRQAWRARRGQRPGAKRAASLPGSTPGQRIRQAAWEGAKRGAREGAARARQKHDGRRAAGRTAGQRARRAAADAAGTAGEKAGYGAGYAAGAAGGWRQDLFGVPAALCDDCLRLCAKTALRWADVQAGGRTERWLLCPECRAGHAPAGPRPEPEPAEAPEPGEAATVVPEPAVTAGEPGALDAAKPGPEPSAASEPDPCRTRGPAVSGPGSPDSPAPGGSIPVTPVAGALATVAPQPRAAGELTAGEPAEPGTAPITGTGEDMSELAIPGSAGNLPARTGEAYNYGAWRNAELSDAQLFDQLGLALDAMLGNLNTVNAGRTQVRNVSDWADRIRTEVTLTQEVVEEMERRYGPVVSVVAGVGGTDEISDPGSGYYEEV